MAPDFVTTHIEGHFSKHALVVMAGLGLDAPGWAWMTAVPAWIGYTRGRDIRRHVTNDICAINDSYEIVVVIKFQKKPLAFLWSSTAAISSCKPETSNGHRTGSFKSLSYGANFEKLIMASS